MNDQPVDLVSTNETPSLFWQDEILQVMFWMRGEGFGTKITVGELRKFLAEPEDTLTVNLSELVKKKLVDFDLSNTYELTDVGVREGGRRFADEFDGMLKQGHYECNDPDCDCNDPESFGECKHLNVHSSLS